MFVLTCPSCNHASRVKFARYNAMATCPNCNARFRVDGSSTSVDRDGAVGGPLHDMEQTPPAPGTLQVEGGPHPAAFASRRDRDEPSAEELWDELFGEAPVPNHPTVHEAPLEWQPRRGGLGLPDRISMGAALMLMAASAVSASIVVGAVRMGGSSEELDRIAQAPVQPVAEPREPAEPDDDARSDSASSHAVGDEDDASAAEEDDDPAAVEDETVEPAPPEPAPSHRRPTVREDPSLPIMQLQRSIAYEPRWERLREPRRPMQPTTSSDVLLWTPRLQHDEQAERTMFTAMFLADTDRIYQSGFLHVQLLDSDGRAIAELKQVVPALNARQGLQIRLMVPEELNERSDDVVAQFTPVDRVHRAVPIEAVDSLTRVHYSGDGPVIELTVTNPNDEPVNDPTVIVELLTSDGWPVGMYRGVVSGTIKPGQSMAFLARPPLENGVEPGRVQIRGYAFQND